MLKAKSLELILIAFFMITKIIIENYWQLHLIFWSSRKWQPKINVAIIVCVCWWLCNYYEFQCNQLLIEIFFNFVKQSLIFDEVLRTSHCPEIQNRLLVFWTNKGHLNQFHNSLWNGYIYLKCWFVKKAKYFVPQ